MTVFYNDLSAYDAGFTISPSTPLVVAKATEGTYWPQPGVNSHFEDFKAQAAAHGTPFSGYHFLKSESSPEDQAQHYFNVAGRVPCMLDVETSGSSNPGVEWCRRFKAALERLGGRVWSVYYPHWYWERTGGDLGSLGVILIASEYRSYDEHNWPAGYGNATPLIWQYTSSPHDTNAFKGTAAQLASIINGGSSDMDPNTPLTFPGYVPGWYPDIAKDGGVWSGQQSANDVWTLTAARVGHIVHVVENMAKVLGTLTETVNKLQLAAGVDPKAVADAELAEIKAKL